MVITVNNTDVTEKIVSDSVRWSRYGTFLTELTFAMETSGSDGTEIKTGMNAELFINEVKVWGGLICETKEVRRSDSRTAISVKCKGYESIAARKVSDAVHFENLTAGQIAAQIFQDYLVNEEGFLYDSENFDLDGELFESYSSAGAKISKLFDDLAQASGKKWWVTTEKRFCFKQSIPVTDSGYCIDLDGNSENSIKNVSAIKFSRKAADYRNIQIVFGKDNVRGEARNETEIARMAEFGGSGEYANVTVNRNILTEEERSFIAYFAYQTEDMKADAIAAEIKSSPTRQKLEKSKDLRFTENNVRILASLREENYAQLEALAEELCRDY